jgi:hypothetical protein
VPLAQQAKHERRGQTESPGTCEGHDASDVSFASGLRLPKAPWVVDAFLTNEKGRRQKLTPITDGKVRAK